MNIDSLSRFMHETHRAHHITSYTHRSFVRSFGRSLTRSLVRARLHFEYMLYVYIYRHVFYWFIRSILLYHSVAHERSVSVFHSVSIEFQFQLFNVLRFDRVYGYYSVSLCCCYGMVILCEKCMHIKYVLETIE